MSMSDQQHDEVVTDFKVRYLDLPQARAGPP